MRGRQGWSRWKMGWMAMDIGCKHQREFAIRTSLLGSQVSLLCGLRDPGWDGRRYTSARRVNRA